MRDTHVISGMVASACTVEKHIVEFGSFEHVAVTVYMLRAVDPVCVHVRCGTSALPSAFLAPV